MPAWDAGEEAPANSERILPRSGWKQLGRFINDRGDSLCARLQALQKGRLYFDARQPVGWQRSEFEGWGAPAQQQRFHQRALEAANRMDRHRD